MQIITFEGVAAVRMKQILSGRWSKDCHIVSASLPEGFQFQFGRASGARPQAVALWLFNPDPPLINNDHSKSEMIARLSGLIEGLDHSRMMEKSADEYSRDWRKGI